MELHEIQQSLAEGSLAILHLDFMAGLFDMANQSDQGSQFVANCTNWHSAVSGHSPQVLSIFTTLAFSHETRPELGNGTPFHKLLQSFGSESFSKHSPATQIAPQFTLTNNDVVLAKTGWYAGTGNALEQILAAQRIRTVIIVSSYPTHSNQSLHMGKKPK